jgi:Protein of unknown function (DUF4199)
MDKRAINLGLLLGGLGIIFTLLFGIANFGMITFFVMVAILLILIAVILVLNTLKIKKQNEGFISFLEAFKYMATAIVISGLISTTFGIIYMQLIDPDFGSRMIDKTLEWTSNMMSNSGLPSEEVEKQLSQIETDMNGSFSLSGQLLSFLKSTIGWAIFALIVSLIIKKEQPFLQKNTPIDQL